jgi:hypothetical protein
MIDGRVAHDLRSLGVTRHLKARLFLGSDAAVAVSLLALLLSLAFLLSAWRNNFRLNN